ncbi:unnamed protein product [Oppiella nova]|uniref:Uncharacterized protein n=1 Tax=Oppiella nova TaxID=334625 RepID=A0A7R9M4M7_9ACAR|nr:unnamed protein product [Oppiella nova]CAG2170694.1 unnamed protein product [Oppiella nova]
MNTILIVLLSVCIGLSSQSLWKSPIKSAVKSAVNISNNTGKAAGNGQDYCKISSALVLENFLDVENYNCESGSYITQIAINKTLSKPFACYAYAGFTSNITFDAYKGDLSVPLWSPQHQEIFSTNNGNFEYMECGVLSGGPCDGDTIWNTGLWMATDQSGCGSSTGLIKATLSTWSAECYLASGCGSSTGLKGLKGLYAQFEIIGKCASKCTLVNGELTASTPITNNGSAA